MKITRDILKKYARVIVRNGVNVQKDQTVYLTIAVEQADFAALITEECYLAGAKKVRLEWYCDRIKRLDHLYASTETLSEVAQWEIDRAKRKIEELPICRIFIESDDPDSLAGIDPEKVSTVEQAHRIALKFYDDAIDGKNQWVIATVPSPEWAMKCFPGLSQEEAVQKLWDAILLTSRVSETNDPVTEWKEHSASLEKKAEWLSAQRFVTLRYKSANGTDFTVGLIPEARWEGAGSVNQPNAVYYIPNMPTEEVFTSPYAGKCEGTLVATKPLSWQGQLIENFAITFRNGRAVSVRAEKGQELLERMIRMDENASMLGEVALVPKESPVNRCGFLFYNSLFDENACCHVALGDGFKEVLPDGDDITVEGAKKRGVNDSAIHVDFMVGSDDLSVTGIRADGSETPVFVNGTWVF